MRSVLLIAEREFRTYVATLSFWLSLAIAPLAGGVLLLLTGGHPAPSYVSIHGGDTVLVRSAGEALQEAGRLEGRTLLPGPGSDVLTLSRTGPGTVEISFSADFPLSPVGRAMTARTLERDVARDQLGVMPLAVHEKHADEDRAQNAGRLSNLAMTLMLWLALVGSLGMLLQAIVRERTNRALESLLAAAQGWEIIAGKMLGVGLVSLLILVSWLGSSAFYAAFLPPQVGQVSLVLAELASPLNLLRGAVIYACAFAFYGSITVALGAMARDSASAQNLVRPMFVLLLIVFFTVLFGGAGALHWLIYLPPFTPFLLLADSPEAVAPLSQMFLLAEMLVSSLLIVILAARLLYLAPRAFNISIRDKIKPQPVV